MIQKVIDFSIKNKLVIGLFIIILIGIGIYQATRLPIDAVPDITNNQVQIITIAPSLGATDIERLVTFPIEQANSNISGLKEIRSFSRFGLSLVTIVFEDNIDIYWARQQVNERLLLVKEDIPKGVGTISLAPITSGLGEIYQYTLRAKPGYEHKYDAMKLRTIQDWLVRRQLLGVKGVADVSSFGGKLKQYEIAVNTNKLQANNITINEVFDALEKNNQNTGGAYIEKGPTVLYIRSEGLVGNIEDIQSVFIKKTATGTPILIRDIADVRFGFATRYGAMCYNDEGEVAGAVVMMLKGENSSEVIKNVKERVAQIQKSLPEGVVLEPFLDRTKMVNNAIGTVEKNLLEGALIVLFILVLFLGNFRAGLIVASVIPLSMLFAICMMNLFGVSGNLMSLGALDFGLIVDGAVIIVEAILHQLTHSKLYQNQNQLDSKQLDSIVFGSSTKMMNSAIFGQLIILIVYLPILTLEGIEGKMFKPMVQTVVFALIGAFILSLTYVPMMSALIMSKKISHKKTISDKIMEFIEKYYQKALEKILNYRKTIVGSAVGLFLIALLVLFNMGGEFIPALEEGDFALSVSVLPGSNINTTIENTQKVAHILKTKFPEVKQVVTKIGSGEIPTDPMPMEAADMMVILKDKKEWKSAKTFNELAEKMSKEIEEVPGIVVSFQYPVQMRFNELMTGAKQDVVCKIYGEDLDTLSYYANQLGDIVGSVEGSRNTYIEPVVGMPQIIIQYNRAIIAQYGLSIQEINRVINTGLAGQSTGFVYEGEKRFDMIVRLDGEQRKNIDEIRNLLIPTSSGNQIPLSQLADVSIKQGPNQIQREDAKRRIIVGFNVRGRDVQSIVTDLQNKVNTSIKLPAGYFITYGGSFENLNAAKARLSIAVPIALLLIFLLLYFSFNSIKQGLLIYTAIPLSAIGGIFFLALRGMPFSISAGVGFIALFGVAVLNGIVLIAEFNRLKTEGWTDSRRIVLMGTKIRLRPVLMTACVASLGFLPMALSNGAGAEVQRPLATVVIGGLMIATLLTLFVLPILYILFEDGIKLKTNKITTIIIVLCFISTYINAQSPININEAIQYALKNNATIKNEKLKETYTKSFIKSAADIPKTDINAEFGQFNSAYFDTKFGINQSFNFPTVYIKQKNVYQEAWKAAVLNTTVQESLLKKSVSQVYYYYLILKEKEKVLLLADTLYSNFYNKAVLRFKSGESNILEKATADIQQASIKMQLQQLQKEISTTLLEFQLLLNTDSLFIPNATNALMDSISMLDSTSFLNNPYIKQLEQQINIAQANTAFAKTKLLPDFNIAYNNMSIKGTGADNNVYAGSTRFQSAQVGIAVPLFFGSQKAMIHTAQIAETIAATNLEITKSKMEIDLKKTWLNYENSKSMLNYYQTNGAMNIKLITTTANRQFQNGEINYLDWVVLINQALNVQTSYINAIQNYNEQIIEMNYITSK